MTQQNDMQKRMQQVESLIRKIENLPDPEARSSAMDLVQALMDFHGAGLERLMEIVAEAGDAGYAVFDNFGNDNLVGSLLLLYGLHPVDFETRIRQALEKVRPYLESHGGNVDLLSVSNGNVRLRLEGSCKSCPSSSMTLKLAIEEAIYAAAPDVVSIEAEGVAEQKASTGFVQIGKSGVRELRPIELARGNGWEVVNDLDSLAQSSVKMFEVSGRSVLFCRLGESYYAYGNDCPDCGKAMQGAQLESTNLICPHCQQQYDVIRAGRGLDQPNLYLEPFPLLIEQGQARVSLPPLATT